MSDAQKPINEHQFNAVRPEVIACIGQQVTISLNLAGASPAETASITATVLSMLCMSTMKCQPHAADMLVRLLIGTQQATQHMIDRLRTSPETFIEEIQAMGEQGQKEQTLARMPTAGKSPS
jgi:hypothetical protein